MRDKLYFVMDEPKTVYYKFTPRIEYGLEGHNYGYVCGGSNTSIIDRISFSLEAAPTIQVGGLSTERRNETAANNSSEHGYVCGGRYVAEIEDILDRFLFPLDAGNAVNFADLARQKYAPCAINSSCAGYVCAGRDTDGYIDLIERYEFAVDIIQTSHIGNISQRRFFPAGCNSSVFGYICGGVGNSMFSTIERFSFSMDEGEHGRVALLGEKRAYAAGNSSTQHGYVCGGSRSTIERFNFALDDGQMSQVQGVGFLEANRDYLAANNSTTHGFVCGGDSTGAINRFTFPMDSGTANIHSSLTTDDRERCSANAGVNFVKLFTPIISGPGPDDCMVFRYDPFNDTGFYGFMSSNDVISGDDLANHLGLTEGTSMNSNCDWMKFFYKGKILLTPVKSFRKDIKWMDLYNKGAVYGTDDVISDGEYFALTNDSTNFPNGESDRIRQDAEISINGWRYRIRLMTGAYDDPFEPTTSDFDCQTENLGEDSEWNRLIYRIHEKLIICDPDAPLYHGGPQDGGNWSQLRTDEEFEDLNNNDMEIGEEQDGSYVLMQETWNSGHVFSTRCVRGYQRLEHFTIQDAQNTSNSVGWRPVLEMIGEDE